MFNLSAEGRVLSVTKSKLGMNGRVRDLCRQKEIGDLGDRFSAMVSSHGAAFVKVTP
jgi:hypothetical protein